MSRAQWKKPYISIKNLNTKIKDNQNLRNTEITTFYLNKTVSILNGKTATTLLINKSMLNYKFGEFSITRQPFKYKKK